MQYIIKNYRYFMKKEKTIFLLAMACIIISTFILHFAYGLYQNKNSNLDNEPNMYVDGKSKWIEFEFNKEAGKEVTRGDLTHCLEKLSKNMDLVQANGNSDFTLFICYADLDWNFPIDLESTLRVIITEDGIEAPTIIFENMLSSGQDLSGYWTNKDEEEGNKVCVFPVNDGIITDEKGVTWPEYSVALNKDGTASINGTKYSVIGYSSWIHCPMMPFSSLDENTPIKRGYFAFVEEVTGKNFDYISQLFIDELGADRVTVDDSLSYRKDIKYNYRTVLIMAAIMCVLVAMNYMVLYTYLLERRKRTTSILRICGMARWKGCLMNMGECILLTVPFYLISATIYGCIVLPRIREYFTRMQGAYNFKIYIALFGIYIMTSVVICGIGVIYNSRGSIVLQLRKGTHNL